jgi:hypothetical protein
LLPSGGLLERGVLTLAQHNSNESWNRYHPEDVWNVMCQHSHYTGVMNPGIVTIRRKFGTRCSNTRTTWDKWGTCRELPAHRRGIHWRKGFCRELPAHTRGIHPRKGIPPGITSLLTQIQAGKIQIRGKSFER